VISTDLSAGIHHTGLVYFRVSRQGWIYAFFASKDGACWTSLGGKTFSTIPNNLWIVTETFASDSGTVPIQAFDWIRLGSNALDPW
jgi:hypothetical protein